MPPLLSFYLSNCWYFLYFPSLITNLASCREFVYSVCHVFLFHLVTLSNCSLTAFVTHGLGFLAYWASYWNYALYICSFHQRFLLYIKQGLKPVADFCSASQPRWQWWQKVFLKNISFSWQTVWHVLGIWLASILVVTKHYLVHWISKYPSQKQHYL